MLKICYQNPCISARWSTSFNVYQILHIGTWLRVNILAMLQHIQQFYCALGLKLLKASPVSKKWCYGDNTKKQLRLLIYLRVTEDMTTKLRKEHCLQQTRLQYWTAKIWLILYNDACISARWSTSLDAYHILHTDTWLRGEHSGKCCSISCNSVVFQVTNWWKHCWSAKKDDAMVIILTITRNY